MSVHYSEFDCERRFSDTPDRERHQLRPPFEVDKARIIHSSAFRRLQGKTQVIGAGQKDFYRTRLTHTLEVAQLGRGLCREASGEYRPDADLVEAVCLGHDIGHPPFGHAGERCLNRLLRQAGGFNANAQNLRIVCFLEAKHPNGGLNLTRATLDGLMKYTTLRTESAGQATAFLYDSDKQLRSWVKTDIVTDLFPIEGQIAEWVDTVAYSVDDIEDNLHAGLFDFREMERRSTEIAEVASAISHQEIKALAKELQVTLIDRPATYRERSSALKDWTSRTMHAKLMKGCKFVSRMEFNRSERYMYGLEVPDENRRFAQVLKAAAEVLVFRDPRLRTLERKGEIILTKLFEELAQDSDRVSPRAAELLPYDFQEMLISQPDEPSRLRIIGDFLSGMTERYAMEFYSRLFVPMSGTYEYL